MCGEVVYEIRGPIAGINYCHCKQCRKASGTAFATSAAVARESFVVLDGQGNLTGYQSSPGKTRYFCGKCGSPIYSDHAGFAAVYIRLGTLDADPIARPEVHIHTASKAPWYEINDTLPQLEAEEGLWF